MLPLLLACASTLPTPVVDQIEVVVPGPGLPAEVSPQDANNNLDVVVHDGAVFFAFRTAPTHFASSETELVVLRSEDQQTWTFETRLAMDTDLREPRFLSWGGELFLYFAVLGDDPLAFEPQGTMLTVRDAAGAWSDAEWLFTDDFIPWRTRVMQGVPTMIGYTGGGDIYESADGLPDLDVRWLQSDDGRTWTGAVNGDGTVTSGGGSETDMAFMSDGTLVAVTRNEAGDDLGWGSKVCRAEADAPGDWTCVGDPRKYDSPLVFADDDRVWLIGRRHLTEDGHYDLEQRDKSHAEQTQAYNVAYWNVEKRCSLWEVDPDALAVTWVLDLPGRGDTCFASALDEGEGAYRVYNYSNDIDGPDLPWLQGQLAPTLIYSMRLATRGPLDVD